ncbi:Uncharacterised protein [Burkholderia pseudomallei]|nr:Uncharacterised protein [Burkholderia pseudomallei]CAJ4601762.1 Uncharacterised protein [Burkholderia pseudomallei]CAJ4738648.1 Uncharacterised protein [Burkholderia pseudomallei]CAJ7272430.1 Uncharacterised protein [Burkholderia pseudomallei]CAJ9503398.1 Uncharacterised protein [Burkholderia pseudomallei]
MRRVGVYVDASNVGMNGDTECVSMCSENWHVATVERRNG